MPRPVERDTLRAPLAHIGRLVARPSYQAYLALQLAFVAYPVVAGIDKFVHLLTNWDQYLAPVIGGLLGGHRHEFMLVVGVIEIVVGIGVALRPRIFGYVVAAWFVGIVINFLLIPGFYDIAVTDLGLALGAFALARLAEKYESY